MRNFRLIFTLFFVSLFCTAYAQPPLNDECEMAFDLGIAPICDVAEVFTNAAATTSANPAPTCFIGGGQRDVWFTFTTASDIETYEISLQGLDNGNGALTNPQMTIYRGSSCDRLSELACFSAEQGATELEVSLNILLPDRTYYIRVNDYSATSTPNSGDFTLCIEEIRPSFNMGEVGSVTACKGTLFDSGGPDESYTNNEDATFTICSDQPSGCILLELENYDQEVNSDFLSFYAGDNTDAPLISRLSGTNVGNTFPIQARSECVTVEFTSDFFVRRSGFELTWQCESSFCFPSSIERQTMIPSLPYNANLTTCGVPSTFAETACGELDFLSGPEKVLTYESPGGICARVELSNGAEGIGVIVLSGPPDDPNATCVGQSANGSIRSVDLQTPGTYYFVIAAPNSCTPFNIDITPTECLLSPALTDALCNPFNGCINDGGTPSRFTFQDGFQDINLIPFINSGCWQDAGTQADFFWFTIEAQADGDFGFILSSADEASDIDFNVWGPFSSTQVCDDKEAVINEISFNQPIRSSWSPTPGATGLADIHPLFRYPVDDNFDCGTPFLPNQGGDDFVQTIDAQEGEVYVVLVNDYGNNIQEGGILIDWSPSDPDVLDRLPIEIVSQNLEVCSGESAQIVIDSPIENISWSPTNTLSCSDCPNPIATPEETTVYTAIVQGVCTIDTITVEVKVITLDLVNEYTVCLGEAFQIEAPQFTQATYEWIAPDEVNLSCTDCFNPTLNPTQAGTYTIEVNLLANGCPASETITLTVLDIPAPSFVVAKDAEICIGDVDIFELGDPNNDPSLIYNWTSSDGLFTSNEPNPTIDPSTNNTYFVEVSNGVCPVVSTDSVKVEVFVRPMPVILSDTTICLGDTLTFGLSEAEEDVIYSWTGPGANFENDSVLTTLGIPNRSGVFSLVAARGACVERLESTIEVIQSAVAINPLVEDDFISGDTVQLCLGETLFLEADSLLTLPRGILPIWSPDDGTLSDTIGQVVTAQPITFTKYFATVENQGCVSIDSIIVLVDSLPPDLSIMPADTSFCEGGMAELVSPIYEPFEFPRIDFTWTPQQGQLTPDSLYNMVVTPDTTITYFRETRNGACFALDSARIEVNPNPIVEILPEQPIICPGETLPLQAIITNNVMIESYMWEPATGLSCTDCPNPTASLPETYSLTVMSDKMCPGSASITVERFTDPIIQLAVPAVVCIGDSIQLNQAFSFDATYTWSIVGDPTFSSNDPLLRVAPDQTTTYRITATNGNCPPLERELTVTVVDLEALQITPDTIVCQDETFTLSATTGSDGSYVWFQNGEPVATTNEFTTSSAVIGTLMFEVEFTSDFGCGSVSDDVVVEVQGQPEVDSLVAFSGNDPADEFFVGSEIRLETFLDPFAVAPDRFEWYEIVGNEAILIVENGSSGLTITAGEAGTVTYEVVALTEAGCEARTRITLNILPAAFQVPNVFTPNGDDLNDVFRVLYPEGLEIESFEMQVYSRWGNLVFESDDIDNGWDGRRNGELLPSDMYVFYYNVRVRNSTEEFFRKGDIILLR